ncbi:DUF6343 family protein [Streptomyces sp. NPDC005012]|uniref:DUF6343 family protein n=1 Tax=Streptomyces sp. NPDC005012 TaxID=3154558 RepID=UPI0033ABE833
MDRKNTGRREEPVTRRNSGTIGRRSPRTGTEPVTARSALGLRLLLSAVFLPVFVALTVFFALWAADAGPGESPSRGTLVGTTVVCAVVALLAALDLLVVLRRRRRERGGGRGGRRGG